jgi:hypothetical protein
MARQRPQQGVVQAQAVVRRVEFDPSDSVSTSVLMALDSLPEFDAASSDEVLFEHVDPDALDALFDAPGNTDRARGMVSFPVGDYDVLVRASGEILIQDT